MVCLLGLLAGRADAASVSMAVSDSTRPINECGMRQSCVVRTEPVTEALIRLAPEAGEAIDVSANFDVGTSTFVLTSGTPVAAGAGCSQRTPAEVSCTAPHQRYAFTVLALRADLGPADDHLVLTNESSRLTNDNEPYYVRPEAEVDGGGGSDDVSSEVGRLAGGAGDDTLTGGRLLGGDGNDTLHVTNANFDPAPSVGGVEIDGEAGGGTGDDVITGDDADQSLRPGPGRDRIDGGGGRDVVVGEQTADVFKLGGADGGDVDDIRGVEVAAGRGGDDTLVGTARPEALIGGPGDDVLVGGDGGDLLVGGSGVDRIDGGAGGDMLAARETISYGVTFGFPAGPDPSDPNVAHDDDASAEPALAGILSAPGRRADGDLVLGQAGGDVLFGDAHAQRLIGGDGADRIFAEGGADHIEGGRGDDRIDPRYRGDYGCGPGDDAIETFEISAATVLAGDCERIGDAKDGVALPGLGRTGLRFTMSAFCVEATSRGCRSTARFSVSGRPLGTLRGRGAKTLGVSRRDRRLLRRTPLRITLIGRARRKRDSFKSTFSMRFFEQR